MKIVYIILAHRFPKQLARLVSRLDAPSVTFLVHIDGNTDDATHGEMVNAMLGHYNLFFLPRHRCSWSGWGIVQATLEGLEQVIRSGLSPDYVVLLSGQDYPLRSPAEIELFFAAHCGTSFIGVRQLPDYTWNWHGSLDRFRGQSLPAGMKPFGGSQWWALRGDCAAYIKGVADGDRDLMRLFERVGVPDEHFFQTVIANSPFRDRLSRTDTRAVQGVTYNDWERGSPKVLGVEDFERLIASHALFARKFDMAQDSAILDMIDAYVARGGGAEVDAATALPPATALLPATEEGNGTGDRPRENDSPIPSAVPDRPRRAAPVRDQLLADGRMVLYQVDTMQRAMLNPTAAFVWACCDGAHDLPAIVAEVRELFPSVPTVEHDVTRILKNLHKGGMLASDEGGAAPQPSRIAAGVPAGALPRAGDPYVARRMSKPLSIVMGTIALVARAVSRSRPSSC